jgi:uncharacterized membrane protein (Fun14 family)
MDQELDHLEVSSSQVIYATLMAEAPWNAKSVIAAGIAMVGGLTSWVTNLSSPAVAGIGGSYLAGFFIGWVSRRFLRIAALLTGAVLVGIAVLEETGWINLDWASMETQIHHAISAAHREAEGLKHLLSGYLPSTGAAAACMFFGFRKK